MKCFVYRNLNRKGHVYSLKALEGPYKGRVVGYSSTITIKDPEFIVNPSGHRRALRESRRNVHAGVVGEVLEYGYVNFIHRLPHRIPTSFTRLRNGIDITYNPWKYDTFIERVTEKPIYQAKFAQFFFNRVEAFDNK